jgi:glyoxylase-like metal-dependent hydrolase (beta-lactamase superfamily II)
VSQFRLDYPFATPPAPAEVQEVAAGILWIRMPLPFALDHINLWALEDGDGWALVDSGLGNDETRALWGRLFDGPLAGRRVTRLIATHCHPDHMGLAGWLTQRFGVDLTATLGEWTTGRMLWLETGDDYAANQIEYYRRAGYSEDLLAGIRERRNTYRTRIDAIPPRFTRLQSGESLVVGGRRWRMIEGGGHSPEHACLYSAEAGVLISGDQVLPRISPIVGVWPQEPDAEPLSLFLDALERLKAEVPADTLVLPSHGLPFRGLHGRVVELQQHHAERLERTLSACDRPVTALDVLKVLFRRPLDPHQTGFATGESVAHLHHLMRLGTLIREVRPDGVWMYRRG